MGRNGGGYTIIEVMIVIAITGILFLSSVLIFQQQQGRTEFSQAMQDIASKIQGFASEVNSGTYDGNENYFCTVNGAGLASLTKASSDNSGCVFLGRAVQIDQGQGDLKSYAILGSRDVFLAGDTGQLATTIDQSNPTLATYTNAGSTIAVSEEDYQLPGGATFISSKGSAGGSELDLVGIYNNLQASSGTTGSGNNLLLRPYYCNIPNGCTDTGKINACLAASAGGCGSSATNSSKWLLCIQAGNGRKAQLEVDNNANGLTTKITYDSCS